MNDKILGHVDKNLERADKNAEHVDKAQNNRGDKNSDGGDKILDAGDKLFSPAEKIGELLARELAGDPYFYFFSPDETTSNRFSAVFDASTRAWGDLPTKEWDLPEAPDGHIVEMLSENVLFSTMTGHLMNGEQAMMGSYEAFWPIVTSQVLQQIKFLKQAREVSWREPLPAVNMLSTSTCWRQDHNGFTHQSPAMISTLLEVPSGLANCLFPVDDVMAETMFNYMLDSRGVVNFTTFNKNPEPRYLDAAQAQQLVREGAMIYAPYSDVEPDVVLAAAGDIMTYEILRACEILREDLPGLRLRAVMIGALSYRGIGCVGNKMRRARFEEIFTSDKPLVVNFHGYPKAIEGILEDYTDKRRMRVHGFNEEGSTTTPFEMLRRNAASRYDLAIDVAGLLKREDLIEKYHAAMAENHTYALQNGVDMIK